MSIATRLNALEQAAGSRQRGTFDLSRLGTEQLRRFRDLSRLIGVKPDGEPDFTAFTDDALIEFERLATAARVG